VALPSINRSRAVAMQAATTTGAASGLQVAGVAEAVAAPDRARVRVKIVRYGQSRWARGSVRLTELFPQQSGLHTVAPSKLGTPWQPSGSKRSHALLLLTARRRTLKTHMPALSGGKSGLCWCSVKMVGWL